jgi:signal transduction histidine kinase
MRGDCDHTVATSWDAGGGLAVSADGRDEQEGRYRRHGRRRRREEREARERRRREEIDEELLLGPEEQALRRAHRTAAAKAELAAESLWVLGVSVLLMIFVPPVGLVVMAIWGWRPARRAYRLFVEPKLHERFVQQEVEKQVRDSLSRERLALEGRHARSLEELSASIAHEIRNPITAAKSLVQQMEEDPTSRENVEYAKVALEELQRVERSVSHLLRFARDEEMRVTNLRMSDVVDSALETFRDRMERSGVSLERHVDCEGALRGDPEQLRRIVINLVANAIDALVESHTPDPRLEVSVGENLAGTEVWLRVRDNGPGVGPEARAKLFSPLYTSKPSGTGLGLAICRKLVDAHGGSLELVSEPGSGAEFLVTLPKRRAGEGERT